MYSLIELNVDALNAELDYRRERLLGLRSAPIRSGRRSRRRDAKPADAR